jgi:DNA-binding PadR family transcriptional regulator
VTKSVFMSLAYAIMTALTEDELTGYELAKSFDTSLGFFWHASHQQIYRELKILSQKGWVHSRSVAQARRPDKTLYELTALGLEELHAWVESSSKVRPAKDELLIKLYNLTPDNALTLLSEVQSRRAYIAANLALYERIKAKSYPIIEALNIRARGVALVLDAGIRDAHNQVLWCDQAIEVLQSCAGYEGDTVRMGFRRGEIPSNVTE